MISFHLNKRFKRKGETFQITLNHKMEQGKVLALFGPSGVGKTTIIRMLAGLTEPTRGVASLINVGDEVWFNSLKKINRKPQKRSVGFVFQDYGLFPNMTVRKNIAFGLADKSDTALVDQLIGMMGLEQQQDQKPATLSGGQQQRVALARAMARKPQLLLLDEPLSALDTELRLKLQQEILAIRDTFNTTIILVTHDIAEVFRMADEVIVMEDGREVKKGTPSEIFMDASENNQRSLIAEVLELDTSGHLHKMRLLVGNQVVDWPVPPGKSFQVGDHLVMNPDAKDDGWRLINKT